MMRFLARIISVVAAVVVVFVGSRLHAIKEKVSTIVRSSTKLFSVTNLNFLSLIQSLKTLQA